MMTHNVAMSTSRMDMANIEKYAKITKETYRGMLEKYCYRVLTTDEITSICENGMEIHLSSKECEERLTRWMEEHKNDKETETKEEKHCSCSEHKISKNSCVVDTTSTNDGETEDEEQMSVFDTVVALGNTVQDPLRTGVKQN